MKIIERLRGKDFQFQPTPSAEWIKARMKAVVTVGNPMLEKKDGLDSQDQELRRWGSLYRSCLWYPETHGLGGEDQPAVGFAVDLIAVRSAPGVHLTFDMRKNKWVFSTDDGSPASEWIEVSDTPVCLDGQREHQKSTTDGQTMCDMCGWESPEDAEKFAQHLERTSTWRR